MSGRSLRVTGYGCVLGELCEEEDGTSLSALPLRGQWAGQGHSLSHLHVHAW